MRTAKVIQVIETADLRGNGTDANPSRIVHQFFSLEGKLMMERDDFETDRLLKASYELREVTAARETLETEFAELRTKLEASESSRNFMERNFRSTFNLKERYHLDLLFARRHGFKKLATRNRKSK